MVDIYALCNATNLIDLEIVKLDVHPCMSEPNTTYVSEPNVSDITSSLFPI